MKIKESFFKSRVEVYKYFGDQMFAFEFMSDNTMFFKTLSPVFIEDKLYHFQLGFYYESGNDFFAYSSLDSWLDKFQLSTVIAESQELEPHVQVFFERYKDKI